MLKVVKFGGSSLADADQYKKVKNIIKADPSRKVVVVSAAGKRNSDDHKITDLLYLSHAHIKYGVEASSIFDMIESRYIEIKERLGLSVDIAAHLKCIKDDMEKGASQDFLVSRGEYLSAVLMADYLGYRFVDASEWVTFGYDGEIDTEVSYEKLRAFSIDGGIVTPGFYGLLPNGEVKVMTRGGSDITGALAAAALNADVYENWTDVPGVLMADPRIVKDPLPIKSITYDELRELSYMGAQVLHEATVYPVKECNIPLNIRDTNNPELPGTMILKECEATDNSDNFITGIAGKKDFSIISITKSGMSSSIGTFRMIAEIFENHKVAIEYTPSGIDSISVVVSTKASQKRIYSILGEIEKKIKPENIEITNNISIIAVVGRKMAFKPGSSGKLFAALGQNGINIRMISQGPDERNIIVGTDNKDYEKTIQIIYENFIR